MAMGKLESLQHSGRGQPVGSRCVADRDAERKRDGERERGERRREEERKRERERGKERKREAEGAQTLR